MRIRVYRVSNPAPNRRLAQILIYGDPLRTAFLVYVPGPVQDRMLLRTILARETLKKAETS